MKIGRRLAAGLVLLLSFLVFCYALFQLYSDTQDHRKGTKTYEEMITDYVKEPEEPENETKPKGTEGNPQFLDIDWEGLLSRYPDVVGWIEIPGAGISYPLVQGTDNSYYLHHLPTKESAISGSIFMDAHNLPDFSDSNTVIYGHNMKDGSMFASLDMLKNPAVYRDQPYFRIYLPDQKILVYEIFSVYIGSSDGAAYTYRFPAKSDFQDFLAAVCSLAEYDTGTTVTDTDRIVTLSTCTNSSRRSRFLVHGKQIQIMEGSK